MCILTARRLRISALSAPIWTCQALDLPTKLHHSGCTHPCKRPPKRQLVACYNFQSCCHKHTGLNPQSPERRQVLHPLPTEQGAATCYPHHCYASAGQDQSPALMKFSECSCLFWIPTFAFFLVRYFLHLISRYSSLSFDSFPASFFLPPSCTLCSTITTDESWRNQSEKASAQLLQISSLGSEPLTSSIFNFSGKTNEIISLFTAISNAVEKA